MYNLEKCLFIINLPDVGSWGMGWGRLALLELFLAMASAVGEAPPLSSSWAMVAALNI